MIRRDIARFLYDGGRSRVVASQRNAFAPAQTSVSSEVYDTWRFELHLIFTARCYASAVLAVGLCLCLSVSVCLSQVGVLRKRQNVGSHKQHHTIVQGRWFSEAKDLREIRPGSPPAVAPNTGWVGQNRLLLTNNRLYIENGTRQTHGFY